MDNQSNFYYVENKFKQRHDNFFADILATTPACVKVFDKDLKLVFINAGGLKEHSLDPASDIHSFDYFSCVVVGDRDKIKSAALDAFKGKTQFLEFEHVPGFSKQRWCFSVISPFINDMNGEITYVSLVSMDFTQYAQAEINVKRERRMFKLLLDAAPLCIKWFDKSGNLLSVNRAGREEHFLTKKSDDEIKNWDYMSCIDKEYHEAVKSRVAAAAKGESSEPFIMKHVPGTSLGSWCRSVVTPVKNNSGEVELILFISQDATKEQESEKLEKEHVKELEHFNSIFVNRELAMVELKKENEMLRERIKQLEEGKER